MPMKTIEDQSVLLLYAFSMLLFDEPDAVFIIGFLSAVIYIALGSDPGRRVFRGGFTGLFLAGACFYPRLFGFSPVVAYALLLYKNYPGLALFLALCLYQWRLEGAAWILLQIPGWGAAFLLQRRTANLLFLKEQWLQTRDDSRELTLLLKEKNQMLLKNQDNEIYTATLKERNRIAREIHDHVGHMLSCSILMTGAAKTINDDPAVGQTLNQLEDTLHAAMDNIRRSVHDLHDESVDLKDALERLCASCAFCPVTLAYDMERFVPAEIKYCLIAIVKEGLHNIAKHSNARQAQISLQEHPGLYQLSIKDNGTQKKNSSLPGMGLANITDRVHSLGGSMQIYREDGFQLFITIPKTRKEPL